METVSLLNKKIKEEFKATVYDKPMEHSITFDEVSKLRFVSVSSLRSLLWASAFFLFFLNICLTGKKGDWLVAIVIALAFAMGITALLFADKLYFIVITMHDGTKTKIEIDRENKTAAEAFVAKVNGII